MENFRLRVFRSVSRHLNFRLAAEELLLTQPAVTQQIKALETELGVSLFDRSAGRVTLTPAGKALVPYAERLHDLAQEAQAAVAATTGIVAGNLSVGASQTIGQYLLPGFLAAFLKRSPHAHLEMSYGNTQQMLEELRAGKIEVALIEGPATGHDLKITPFLEDHMVCIVPPHHAWADKKIPVSDLPHAVLLRRELGSGSRRIVERALKVAGVKLTGLNNGLIFSSTEALLSAVEAGLGIAFVSRWAVRNQLTLGTLKLAHMDGLSLRRTFSLATVAGPALPETVQSFCDLVLTHAAELAPRPTGRPAS